MKKIFLSIAAVLFSSQLFAQSSFEGFFGQVSTGYEKILFPIQRRHYQIQQVLKLLQLVEMQQVTIFR